MAEALRRSGRLTRALEAFAAVPAGGPESTDAALGYEDALFASRLPRTEWGLRGRDLLQAALAAEQDPPRHTRLLAAMARAEIYGGQVEQGLATARTALATAQELDDPSAMAHALLAVRGAYDDPSHLPDRLGAVRSMVAAARQAGDAEAEVEGLRLQLVDLVELGDLAAADATQQEAEEAIARLGRPLYLRYPPMWRAMRALLAGDLDLADLLVADFDEEGRRWHYRDVDLVHAVQLLQLHSDRGEPERALATVTAMTDRSRRVGHTGLLPTLQRGLEPWAGHVIVLGSGAVCLGSASHYLGLAARARGDLAGAASHLRTAVQMNESLAAAPAAERSRAELARTLVEGVA